ncbi:hypothetical protein CL628_01135 [bacterium]|nr:hypothetical protein [bacterium]
MHKEKMMSKTQRSYGRNLLSGALRCPNGEKRDQVDALYPRYRSICDIVTNSLRANTPYVKLPDAVGKIIASALVHSEDIEIVTFECLPYDFDERFQRMREIDTYCEPTESELAMIEHSKRVCQVGNEQGVRIRHRLILADPFSWSGYVWQDSNHPPEFDRWYIEKMRDFYAAHELDICIWTDLFSLQDRMKTHDLLDQNADVLVQAVRSQLGQGEVSEYVPSRLREMSESIAERHVICRACEGLMLVERHKKCIVLSTENPKRTKQDHLLASPKDYPVLYTMPLNPHRP